MILPREAFTVALHKRTTVGKVMDGKGWFVFLNFCMMRRLLLNNKNKRKKKSPKQTLRTKLRPPQQSETKNLFSHEGQDRTLASSVTWNGKKKNIRQYAHHEKRKELWCQLCKQMAFISHFSLFEVTWARCCFLVKRISDFKNTTKLSTHQETQRCQKKRGKTRVRIPPVCLCRCTNTGSAAPAPCAQGDIKCFLGTRWRNVVSSDWIK